jgi:hypothetical protein
MMPRRYGVRGTAKNGIFFTEAVIPGAHTIRHISVEISRQNSTLGEVKEQLAGKALSAGANCVMNFKYGQRKHAWHELIALKWDTESWYGEGDAVHMP